MTDGLPGRWKRYVAVMLALSLAALALSFTREAGLPATHDRRRLSGRDIVAELMDHRLERKKELQIAQSSGRGVASLERLDLTEVRLRRSTYYDPLHTEKDSKLLVTINHQRGTKSAVNDALIEDIGKEREARFSATAAASPGALPSSLAMPLVVLVAGRGALHAWPTLLYLDASRTPPVASCAGGSSPRFDLVLLVPHDDASSLLPCFGSQGCDKAGIALGASGLTVVKGNVGTLASEDDLAAESLKLWDQGVHSALVVVSASSLVSASALGRLVDAVRPSVAPAKLDVAVPVAWGLFGGGGGVNDLDRVYGVSAGDLAFAGHPLNPARVQAALDELPSEPSVSFDNGVFSNDSSSNGGGKDGKDGKASNGGLSAVALSPKAVRKLRDAKGHKGLVHGLRKLARADTDVEVGVLRRAFVHANLGYGANVLEAMPRAGVVSGGSDGDSGAPQPVMGKSPTLVAICAAGVPDKTLAAIVSLEADLGRSRALCGSGGSGGSSGSGGNRDPVACAAFDLVVGVSPFPGDRTADYLAMGGVALVRQPAALGLSDLWNRLVRFAFKEHGYAHLIISNNDVLIPPGAVGGTVALLRASPNKFATVLSQKGGGTEALGNPGTPLAGAPDATLKFAEHAANFRLVQAHLSRAVAGRACGAAREQGSVSVPVTERKSFIGFFWGVSKGLADRMLLKDGSGRLFNTTARLNFGQETELMDRIGGGANVVLNLAAYVHHFRGQTLGGCQNGHRNCAQWQVGHHADQTYHINGYAPKKDVPRPIPWWEPNFGNDSPSAWKEAK